MATFYPHFRLAKKMGAHEFKWPVASLKELIQRGKDEYGEAFIQELEHATILVNGRAANYLKGMNTPLTDKDKVSTLNWQKSPENQVK